MMRFRRVLISRYSSDLIRGIKMKFKKRYLTLPLVAFIFYLLWPIYGFFAHKGKLPHLVPGEQTVNRQQLPIDKLISENHYNSAAEASISSLKEALININGVAITAAVSYNNSLIFNTAIGWADVNDETPVTRNHLFRIGSTSKAVTSALFARLVDDGALNLDTAISEYMDVGNPSWEDISARQLLSHTSGLPHYKENTDKLGLYKAITLNTEYQDVMEAITLFDDSELLFAPGEHFSYSSYGTVLLSGVIQQSSNIPYTTLIKNQLVQPLGITFLGPEYDYTNTDKLVTFYWNDEGRNETAREWRQVDLSHRLAGGGLVATSAELAILGNAMLDDNFISPSTRDEFWQVQTLNNGDNVPQKYALGWRLTEFDMGERGTMVFPNHGGVSRGAQSFLMVIPTYNMAIAININSNTDVFWDFGAVSLTLAKAFMDAIDNR